METDLRGIFTDESNQLGADGLEFLRYVYDKSGCPLIIVALPDILNVIERYTTLHDRIGHELQFLPSTEEEVLNTILPELIIPRWVYDPANEADRKMGQELWAHARFSFRRLRTLIAKASQFAEELAETPDEARITPDILQLAYARRASRQTFLPYQPEEKVQPDPPQTDEVEAQSDTPQTNYEADSEKRHEARKKKKKPTEDGEDEQ